MKSFRRFLLFAALGAAAGLLPAQSTAPVPTSIESDSFEARSTDTETISHFTGNVRVVGTNLRITCDQLEVIALRTGDPEAAIGKITGFKSLLATGNVRIIQGDREAACGRAVVLPGEDLLLLQENPVLVDHAANWTCEGEEIELHRGKHKVLGRKVRFIGPALQDLGVDREKLLGAPAPAPATPDQP